MASTLIEINIVRRTGDVPFLPSELIWLSVGFAILAVVFAIYGFKVAYTYNSFDDATKIVGGDAYNYIIIGLRGCAWLLASIASSIFSALFALMAFLRQMVNWLAFSGQVQHVGEMDQAAMGGE